MPHSERYSPMPSHHFDIIICGAGASGLSLAYRAIKENVWKDLSILIIDAGVEKPEKTWCFWQNSKSPFEDIVYKKWSQFSFYSNAGEHLLLNNGDYDYKMIRSVDFYEHTLSFLKKQVNVSFLYAKIDQIISQENGAKVHVQEDCYTSRYVFNSTFSKPKLKSNTIYLLQHFKGYFIRTSKPLFDEHRIYFMDFRVPQTQEYTLFSHHLLEAEAYTESLKHYLSNILKLSDYEIVKEEFGVIPMTDFKFERRNGNVLNIGTQGGDTRASTGYTFNTIQKTVGHILQSFKDNGHPYFEALSIPRVHQWFDSTILQVLDKNEYQGHAIFTDIFKKVKADTVLKFLDGDTNGIENLQVMRSVKAHHFIVPFVKAILK
jgi:lycopene beta-cyclase